MTYLLAQLTNASGLTLVISSLKISSDEALKTLTSRDINTILHCPCSAAQFYKMITLMNNIKTVQPQVECTLNCSCLLNFFIPLYTHFNFFKLIFSGKLL